MLLRNISNYLPVVTLHKTHTFRTHFHEKLIIKSQVYIYIYTGCPRRNVPDFRRVFLMLKYTDITQNTYVQS